MNEITHKPHLFTEHGELLMVEHTAPGEWWTSLAPTSEPPTPGTHEHTSDSTHA